MPDRAARQRRRGRKAVFSILAVVFCVVLGVAITAQVRTAGSDDVLDGMRQQDLLELLDQLNATEAENRAEIEALEETLAGIIASGSDGEAALEQALAQRDALAIQAGIVAARGPGVVLIIRDPSSAVGAEVLLDQVQELRAAGAEAIQVTGSGGAGVRVGTSTWFTGPGGQIVAEGVELAAPYVVTAIGDPDTLAAALDIPGGAIDTVARNGGRLTIEKRDEVVVDIVRELPGPLHARPGGP
ncbi:DUF881 domain-containing protein [Lolliginicoccus levis]|uniref:DUF881 domain-containing protein n=1 Tax=Lolliginicoccus levis TaxID=2919542 RepID=UPI00241C7A81|nr:DUF881 domain-containing protein [Lolliginicoccus levis]